MINKIVGISFLYYRAVQFLDDDKIKLSKRFFKENL